MKHFVDINAAETRNTAAKKPVEFAFVLCPGFSMLDYAAAVEPISLANRLAQRDLYRWTTLSEDGNGVRCSNGTLIPVDDSIRSGSKPQRLIVCAFENYPDRDDRKLHGWLRRQERTGVKLGALGTGSAVLVSAGLVRDRDFTIHWSVRSSFSELHADHAPRPQIFTLDRDLATCAGGHAVTDMMLAMIAQDNGHALSHRVAEFLVSGCPRSAETAQKPSVAYRFGSRNKRFLKIIETLEADEHLELSVDDLLIRHHISRRQLERLFKEACGTSPGRYIKKLRLERARELLEQTDLGVLQVAVACGFSTVESFSKSFSKEYRCRPSRYRARPKIPCETAAIGLSDT